MMNGVPWMIGGGDAVHSAEVGRQLAFMASSGATGITLPTDLKVSALPVPGAAVRIAPGGGPIANTYPGAPGQSYVVRNPEPTDVNVPPTGSGSGATSYLIVRIDDPQYNGGQYPADRANGPYVYPTLVPSITGLTYPFLKLAKIDQPASTATITQAMITDLREVAVPRTKSVVFARPAAGNDPGLALNSRVAYPTGEWFPNIGGQNNNGAYYIDIPTWATRMQLRMEWLAVKYAPSAGYGFAWVTYGPNAGSTTPTDYTQAFGWDASQSTQTQVANWVVHQEVAIPAAWRGTTQPVVGRATKTSPNTSPYNGAVTLYGLSGMVLSVRFLEVADG